MAKYYWLILFLFFNQLIQADERLILSLENAREMALKNNPDFQVQLKKIDFQRGWYWSELMPDNPEIGMSLEEMPVGKPYSSHGEKKLYFSQVLEFPSNYFFRHKMNQAFIQQELAALEEMQRELIFQIDQAYWSTVLQKELLVLAQKNVELSQEFFQKSKRSYELGETDRLTMLKAKVHLGTAQQKWMAVQKDLEANQAQLRKLLGVAAAEITTTDSLTAQIGNVSFDRLRAGLASHPALQSANLNSIAMARAKQLSYSSFLPQISLSYFKQKIDRVNYWGGEVSLSIPFWFMKQIGRLQQATAELRIAEHRCAAEKLRLNQELELAVARYEKAANEMRLYQTDLLYEAEEVFRIAKQNYEIGEIGYLDFIDAQQTLIQTREGYFQSLYYFNVEKANLTRLTGIEL